MEASQILLATGSKQWVPPGFEVDGEFLLTSREALESRRIPERLVVVGAGPVGIEFAYVYAMYGSKVTLVEMVDQMLLQLPEHRKRVLVCPQPDLLGLTLYTF